MHPRPALLPTTLIFAYALIPITQAFELTGPPTTEKLDLSQPITVSWDTTGGSLSEPNARLLSLWFYAIFGGTSRGGWEIATNISLANSSSYEWDPSSIAKIMEDNEYELSTDAVHTFEARLLDQNGTGLSSVESDGYELDGVDFVSDGGSSGGDGARAGVFGATVAAAVGIVAALI